MDPARTILLVTLQQRIYGHLAAAVQRYSPSTTRTRGNEIVLSESPGLRLAVALLTPDQPLSPLVVELDADAVIAVDLGVTAASDVAAVGDVLAPAVALRSGDARAIRASASVLDAARALAHEPWAVRLDAPRPGRDDERSAVRFGDVTAVDRVLDRPHARARGLGIIHDATAALGAQVSPNVAFGLVLGVSDDASIEKSELWQGYASLVASEFAAALAARWRPTAEAPAVLFPQRELPAGTRLYRVHRAAFDPLARARMPLVFYATATAALAEFVFARGGSQRAIPLAETAELRVAEVTLRSPLRIADLTVPSARLTASDPPSSWQLDERRIEMILDAGLDGWVSPSRLSADPAWDRIAVARRDTPLPEVEANRSVADALTALEPHDAVAQLLLAAVPQG